MFPIFENTNVKIILYASKIRFKKYPAVFYPFYMYLIYKYLLKMGKKFKIRTVPDDLIFYILNRYSVGCQDPNTTVIVSRGFAASVDLGDFAKIKGDLVKKSVQVFAFDIPDDVVYISETFRFNTDKFNLREPVTLSPLHPVSIKIANEVEICLISSGHDITNRMCDVLLKNYFRSPKLVQKGNIIALNLKQYAPEFSYTSYKTNSVEYVHFKYLKIKCGDDEDCAGDYFCVKGETELKQSAHAHGYVPAKFERFLQCKFENNGAEAAVINKCPYGLEDTLDSLRRAVSPFLKHSKGIIE
ncbi:hypothetical protein AMK59_5431 [Oryctes borbonicus]|uniref:Uncharacterized protein n=1 Tax=Oryctes borbonicus TaxID=1629725 RepID=A0A0T6B242_9SCAR|nr:hypothetical protein AMK59_5431 [Oryctes borbonicus]